MKIQEAERKSKEDENVTKSTQEQKTTQESSSTRNDQVVSSVSVSSDHSYSLSHRTTCVAGGISAGDKQGDDTSGEKATSQLQGTSAIKDNDNACQDKSASNSQSASQSTCVGETNQVTAGFEIQCSKISHSKWLLLQGHYAKGIVGPGKNIQDNTLVNACTVTVQRIGTTQHRDTPSCRGDSVTDQSLPDRTNGSRQCTLLLDFMDQDDGKFTGFRTYSDMSGHILERDNVLNMKWSDVNAMIQG